MSFFLGSGSSSSGGCSPEEELSLHFIPPGTCIRRDLKSMKYLGCHYAIVLVDEVCKDNTFIIEIITDQCWFKRTEDTTKNDVAKNVFQTQSEGKQGTDGKKGFCQIGKHPIRDSIKKGEWVITDIPKSFDEGIKIVQQALEDCGKFVDYNVWKKNCESYVNKWCGKEFTSHQFRKLGGFSFGALFLFSQWFFGSTHTSNKEYISALKGLTDHVSQMFGLAAQVMGQGEESAEVVRSVQEVANGVTADNIGGVVEYFYDDVAIDGAFDDISGNLPTPDLKKGIDAFKTWFHSSETKKKLTGMKTWLKDKVPGSKKARETENLMKINETVEQAPVQLKTVETLKEAKNIPYWKRFGVAVGLFAAFFGVWYIYRKHFEKQIKCEFKEKKDDENNDDEDVKNLIRELICKGDKFVNSDKMSSKKKAVRKLQEEIIEYFNVYEEGQE